MAQVEEIAAQYRELEERGVEVFLISRQPAAHTRALATRFDAPIRFCVDEDGGLSRLLGIEHIGGVPFLMEPLGYEADSVMPTVVIIDPSRRIIFADLTDNYRVRPHPSTFLAAVDAEARKRRPVGLDALGAHSYISGHEFRRSLPAGPCCSVVGAVRVELRQLPDAGCGGAEG